MHFSCSYTSVPTKILQSELKMIHRYNFHSIQCMDFLAVQGNQKTRPYSHDFRNIDTSKRETTSNHASQVKPYSSFSVSKWLIPYVGKYNKQCGRSGFWQHASVLEGVPDAKITCTNILGPPQENMTCRACHMDPLFYAFIPKRFFI